MRNLADAIENFIIRQLLEDREDAVLVQRNELADKLSCAPSQISYVLSTRFTPERGFMVESRRGSGGFVRIVRVMPHELQEENCEPTVHDLIEHWAANRLISRREKSLLRRLELRLILQQIPRRAGVNLPQQSGYALLHGGQKSVRRIILAPVLRYQ